jgi:hypothetical protein
MREGSSTLYPKKIHYSYYPPIITVTHPSIIVPPCAVLSPTRAAGFPPINTVDEPFIILSGGPLHVHKSPNLAAGKPPISTVTDPAGSTGPPKCGTPPGLIIGQMCISLTLAAKDIIF